MSSIFGNANQNSSTPNPFGTGTSSIFSQSNNQQNQAQAKPNPFLNVTPKINTNTSQPQQQSLFGSLGQPAQNTTQSGGIFGSSQPAQTGSLFGSSQPQQTGGLFGQSQPQTQQASSIFGNTQNASSPRSVADQIEVAFQKWNPDSPISLFQTYIYNFTDPKFVPFCQPGEHDNLSKWEEAMSKKPHPGAVPVLVKGFHQLGQRMLLQQQLLKVLQGRLHEINNGLTEMLRRHDLEFSVRAAESKKRHLRLNQQCMRLAAKVQVLRNRGYAMDSAEEELKTKLLALERRVMDPALNGRAEEIWARMVNVRERGRQLQREFEKAGRVLPRDQEQGIDEEVMKKATKILEDYSSQLAHLAKELEQLQEDFEEWNKGRPDTTKVDSHA
ncbi:MAG: hypothetical protein Q9208_005898 [Pyrenodesmia sp. 3 TL-2023]